MARGAAGEVGAGAGEPDLAGAHRGGEQLPAGLPLATCLWAAGCSTCLFARNGRNRNTCTITSRWFT